MADRKPPTTLRSFRNRAEVDHLVAAVTDSQRKIRRACIDAGVDMPSARLTVVACELNRSLFVANCEAAASAALSPDELAIAKADAAALFPRLREVCDAELTVDWSTLLRIHGPEEPDE